MTNPLMDFNNSFTNDPMMETMRMFMWGGPLPYFLLKSGNKLIKIQANQEDIKQNYTKYLSNFKNNNKTKYFNY
jgi:hypothetical protein